MTTQIRQRFVWHIRNFQEDYYQFLFINYTSRIIISSSSWLLIRYFCFLKLPSIDHYNCLPLFNICIHRLQYSLGNEDSDSTNFSSWLMVLLKWLPPISCPEITIIIIYPVRYPDSRKTWYSSYCNKEFPYQYLCSAKKITYDVQITHFWTANDRNRYHSFLLK